MFSIEQEKAYKSFCDKNSIFITGPGGCGKTFLIKKIITFCEENAKSIAVCALTGCAASLIDGTTLHSALSIPCYDIYDPETLYQQMLKRNSISNFIDVLIIDEISMMNSSLFDALDYSIRQIRGDDRNFGGIQLLFSGDFMQLSPIRGEFCFKSNLWDKIFPRENIFYFPKIFRQEGIFSEILERTRLGETTCEDIALLNKNICKLDINGEKLFIFPTNKQADHVNTVKFDDLANNNTIMTYKSKSTILSTNSPLTRGDTKLFQLLSCKIGVNILSLTQEKLFLVLQDTRIITTEHELKNKIRDDQVKLCCGCRVMLYMNMKFLNLYNGSCGVVKNLTSSGVVVKFFTREDDVFVPFVLKLTSYKTATRTVVYAEYFLPLKLAWATTAHKSQGMTLDNGVISTANSFSAGQFYTTLSRFKKLDGIEVVSQITKRDIIFSRDAKKFYEKLLSAN